MSQVQIPMNKEREQAAKAEVAQISDDAVVYMLHLSMITMGLAITEENPEAGEAAGRIYAAFSEAMVGEIPSDVPDQIRLKAKAMVEHIFSLMPPTEH